MSVFVSQYRHAIVHLQDEATSIRNAQHLQLADIVRVIKSVYGDRKQLEKSLKNAAGTNQDRVRANGVPK